MKTLFRDVEGTPLCPHGSVACIGAFDGLHLGHQALVGHAVARARSIGVESVAVSFEPLPREVLAQSIPPTRLSLARAKHAGLRALGIDRVGLLRFGPRLMAMSATAFVEQVLVHRLCVREVWIGPGFRFGHGRAGDLHLLQVLGERHGFSAHAIEPTLVDGERVSSSALRELLAKGELDRAARLLGHPYAMSGRVMRGQQLGRTLGYPTANLRLGGKVPPVNGIFATRVHGDGLDGWPSVSSLGTRPTVDGVERLLEAHLFDFDADLYGRQVTVEFVARLRDELRFDNLDALTVQMHRDAAQARAILGMPEQRRGAMA